MSEKQLRREDKVREGAGLMKIRWQRKEGIERDRQVEEGNKEKRNR